MLRTSLLILPLVLTACGETVATRDTTFTYRGDVLRAEVRTYDQGGRVFDRRVIFDGVRTVSCSVTDDLDCAAALRDRRNDFDNR
ncbi:hypothetical protein ACERZ8_00585 [Tateyamaria armeniaca]|uniref:Lipoprotein n=1 Tax=Tateyamaria armeniaca TaxID=2518930 RepID=A0ABW8UMT1_9RHOB